mmetsp:Transcript_7169/g.17833  ORF Transcript_7169/g.17833 Transcript_7169/m.17833 type:complete len:85 (-) Transcript_7169:61-315(-)
MPSTVNSNEPRRKEIAASLSLDIADRLDSFSSAKVMVSAGSGWATNQRRQGERYGAWGSEAEELCRRYLLVADLLREEAWKESR